ncbi:MAG TPA: tRNA (N(6)-L-threonylcarbamoyladenosine(37)-C(2))-methylthiotransferase MtaB [Candidatus Wallbacteria bacterium]|nr:tRNA (N(6)-L-threonylcarbamoyladenosine(37)-C(2))-methylthiotransferase MtaB [Candidatus Wallbacteria bacterium]
MLSYAILTLGCKVNQYEEKVITESFSDYDFIRVAPEHEADVYIINSCAITSEAESKARQTAGRLKRNHPNSIIVLTGCYATRLGQETISCVDIYINQASKYNAGAICVEALAAMDGIAEKFRRANVKKDNESGHERKIAPHAEGTRSRVQIKVQDGCKNFCSYCIVPFIRNEEWSKPPETVLCEISDAFKAGFSEVVLTGIHLGKYNALDMDGKHINFEGLLKLIDLYAIANPSVRVRLSSIDPSEITEKIVLLIKNSTAFVPHFHLPLQSGSDKVLAAMNRKYDRKLFAEKIELICDNIDTPAITTDVIVGFPGETQEDFEETFSLLSELPFYDFHIFQYSDRAGTRASSMKPKVTPQEKKKRSELLHQLKKKKNEDFYRKNIGRNARVIVEKTMISEGKTFLEGHTERYIETIFEGSRDMIDKMITVRLTGVSETHDGMTGEII